MKTNSYSLTKKLLKFLVPFLIIVIFVVWLVIPLAYTVLWSLVDADYPWSYPDILPAKLAWDNWKFIWQNVNILPVIGTSFFVAICTTILSFLLALPTSYAIARADIKGKGLFKTLILLPMVLPGMAIAIFVGRIIFNLGFSGTHFGVILAHTLMGVPYMMRILIVNFEEMPQDLIDASANLGAGVWNRIVEVYIPMILPGLVAGAIFTFINSMEEFNLTFIVGLPTVRTIPTVLFSYLGDSFQRTRASVVSLILLIPNITLLLITERFIKTEHMGAALGKM